MSVRSGVMGIERVAKSTRVDILNEKGTYGNKILLSEITKLDYISPFLHILE